jgi:hypothetical protein
VALKLSDKIKLIVCKTLSPGPSPVERGDVTKYCKAVLLPAVLNVPPLTLPQLILGPLHPKNVSPLGRGDFSIGFFVKDEILFFSFALIAFD